MEKFNGINFNTFEQNCIGTYNDFRKECFNNNFSKLTDMINKPKLLNAIYNNLNIEDLKNFEKDISKLYKIKKEDNSHFYNIVGKYSQYELEKYYIELYTKLFNSYKLNKNFIVKYHYLLNPEDIDLELFDDDIYYLFKDEFEEIKEDMIYPIANMKSLIFENSILSDNMIIKLISEGYLNNIYDLYTKLYLNDNIVSRLIGSGLKTKEFLFRISLKNISLDTFKKYIDKDYVIRKISVKTLSDIPEDIFEYLSNNNKLSDFIKDQAEIIKRNL